MCGSQESKESRAPTFQSQADSVLPSSILYPLPKDLAKFEEGRNNDLNLVGNPQEEIGPQNPEGGEVQEELDNPKAKGHKENPQPLTAPKKDRGIPHLL